MPKISILIPNYNHAPYLQQRIDSVLAQSYQDFEVLILDDCSPDNSREVIEKYRNNSKISHIIFNETNSGSTFLQWKKGIDLAKGEWIWIAESDDWCEPNFLETVLENIEKETVVSFAQTYTCIENSGVWFCEYKGKGLQYSIDGKEFVKTKMLPYNGIINASQAIFKKEYFYKISDKYLEFKYCGDWIFWVEMALLGKVNVSGKFLCYFRKHDKDLSSKYGKSGLRTLEEANALVYFNQLLSGFLQENSVFKIHYYQIFQKRQNFKREDYTRLKKTYNPFLPKSFLAKLQLEKWFKKQ